MKNNVILVALAILSISLLFYVKSQHHKSLSKTHNEKKPQEYMTHFSATTFTPEGTLKNKLAAHYWAYQPEIEGSTLIKPHIIIYKPDGSIWTINAKHGFIKQPNIGIIDQIIFNDHVVIKRPATSEFIPMTLETNELLYQPSQEYAKSDKFVVMRKPGLKISGMGMRAFLDRGFVELLDDVKTYYTTIP